MGGLGRFACCLLLATVPLGCKRAVKPPQPKLLVVIVVDQLRGDEIFDYDALWNGGFRRLRSEGRTYSHAFHTHGRTETAAGHATIATGVLPQTHGVVDKSIYLGDKHQLVSICGFGTPPCNADALVVPTLGDRLKTLRPTAKVIALAEKARSAALLGGHQADLTAWHAEDRIALEGRTGGRPGLPPDLERFFARVASEDRIARIWELPRLPQPFASRPDSGAGELDCGHGLTFPHHLTATSGPALVAQWHCTPDSDRSVAETALYVARHRELGKGDGPDLLLLSFSATDIVGHSYGYESLERVAVLTELDRQLGDLLDGLQAAVGADCLLVALTADHGIAPKVAAARAAGHASGRVDEAALVQLVETNLRTTIGPRPTPYVASLAFPFLHLAADLPTDKRGDVAAAAAAALRSHPQVFKAWTLAELADDHAPPADLMQANVFPGRSGDVVVTLQPYFAPEVLEPGAQKLSEGGAQHGAPWDYDRQVPVMLWGQGISAGLVDEEVAVVDLTRTLANRLGVDETGLVGRLLP